MRALLLKECQLQIKNWSIVCALAYRLLFCTFRFYTKNDWFSAEWTEMDIQIREITKYSAEIKIRVDHFLSLLLGDESCITDQQLMDIISAGNTHLFFAFDAQDACVGMLTIGIYNSPSGKKGWIEDVAVDQASRGQGIGEKLVSFAIRFARQHQVDLLNLTSSPVRVAANNLYKKAGFVSKETNVYTMVLNKESYA